MSNKETNASQSVSKIDKSTSQNVANILGS